MHNYIIESNDYIVIKNRIATILKNNNLTDDMVIKYDLLETPIDIVIEDLDTYNFLLPHKVIVCDNAYFLGSTKPRGAINHNEDNLEKYLTNPNKENILILICDKIDTRKKLIKLFDKKDILNNEIIIDDLIKNNLEDYKMDFKTMKYFINYCDNNNERVITELEKLKCYKFDDKVITIEDIDNAVMKFNTDSIFNLIDAIVAKNKKKAYEITNDLLNRGEDISKIIIMVSDQFRLMYNTKELLMQGNKEDKIATILKVHPYRVKLAIEKGYSYTSKTLLTNLNYFFELDYKLKTGNDDPKLIFDLFLAKL